MKTKNTFKKATTNRLGTALEQSLAPSSGDLEYDL